MATAPNPITAAWLTDRLRQRGHLPTGAVEAVAFGAPFESTAAFWTPLRLTYTPDAPPSAPGALLFKRYRTEWFGGGLHEIVFYETIAAEMEEPPVAACYDARSDSAESACDLLLEDLSPAHTCGKNGTTEAQYAMAVRALLKFHTHWWEHPRLNDAHFMGPHGGPLRMANACSRENILTNADHWRRVLLPRFVDRHAGQLSAEQRALCERATEAWAERFIGRTEGGRGVTLLHGDAHTHNMLYPLDPARETACLVDWETYKRGIGAYDLAYMLVYSTPERRRPREAALLPAYHEGLQRGGVRSYSWDDLQADYRLAVIACLFPPMGWQSLPMLGNALTAFEDWRCGDLLVP
jgi:hypothetical protein